MTLGQFEISGVTRRKREAFGEAQSHGPRLARWFSVELDRQRAQEPGQTMPPWFIEASAPLGDQQAVHGLEQPDGWGRFLNCSIRSVVAGVRASSKHKVNAIEVQ